jgi:hypothetical protein
MPQPKKSEANKFSKHLQVCLKPDYANAFELYAKEQHEGNCSAAARQVLKEHLTARGYLKQEEPAA